MKPTHTPEAPADVSQGALCDSIVRQTRELVALKERFFTEQASSIADCARAMAEAFDRGARLLVMGNGGSCTDAQHMAVECTHPIIRKRPSLPAIALTNDAATLTAIGNDEDFALIFAEQLRVHGRSGDVAMAFSTSGKSANLSRALRAAREMGMLTVGLTGKDGGRMPETCDHCFVVPSFSIPRIQETHETLLHLLWDLVHVVRGEEEVF